MGNNKNVKCEVNLKSGLLTVTVDLSKEQGPSSSGKTVIIGTTSGAVEIADGVYANVNIYKKAKK